MTAPRLRVCTAADGAQTWYVHDLEGARRLPPSSQDRTWKLLGGRFTRLSGAEAQGPGWADAAVVVLPEPSAPDGTEDDPGRPTWWPKEPGAMFAAAGIRVDPGRVELGIYTNGGTRTYRPEAARATAASLLAAADAADRLASFFPGAEEQS